MFLKTQTMMPGNKKRVSKVENAMANVLLNARGLNKRPSRAPRKKIGRNDTTMINMEKSNGRANFAVASMIVSLFSAKLRGPRFDNSTVQFSMIVRR